MTVQSEGPITPADGNVSMVFSGLPLNDANTQTTNLDFAWIPDNVESDDSFIVENHSKHDNTDTDNDKDMYTVDVTIQSEGPITPADGNRGGRGTCSMDTITITRKQKGKNPKLL